MKTKNQDWSDVEKATSDPNKQLYISGKTKMAKKTKKIIKRIVMGEGDSEEVIRNTHGKIERFEKAGQMGPVERFRQGNTEVNGAYVVCIEYEDVPVE